ncbi:hypothetical protein STENM327S_08722 [Streptomyces tendae]
MQGFEGSRGADGDQQVGAVQDLAHVPVDQAEVGRRVGPLHQLLVGQLLDVRGVFAGLGAELEQHLALGMQARVPDQPFEECVRSPRLSGTEGCGEDHRVGALAPARLTGVRGPAQEGQGDLGHRGGVGADPLVHSTETVRVLAGVGEHEVGAVAQQQAVGELLVDDADVAGDDHGPLGAVLPEAAEPVQHGLDTAADQGEDEDVVGVLAARPGHGAQELDGGHLAERVRADADLLELAGGGGGSAAQEVAVEVELRVPGADAGRGERAPLPPGVGVRQDGDSEGLRCTCWHVVDARKPFLGTAQPESNKW